MEIRVIRGGFWMRQSLAVLGLALLASAASAGVSIGDKLEPFALKDAVSDKDVDLKAVAGKKATVLMFIATKCPFSNAYNSHMVSIAKAYGDKGVSFVAINPNETEPAAEVAEHAKTNGFTFPVLKDPGLVKADELGAKVTPEVYVYDADWKLRYHGYIGDDRKGADIKNHALKDALEAMLAGKPVEVAETKAFGCTLKRAKRAEAAPAKADAAAKTEEKPAK
jgi:thiol-disulfide isomerase/thioredoxin